MKIIILAAGLCLAASTAFADCKVSKAQYEALKDEMTYQQAVSILGCEGEELSSSAIGGIKTIMMMWHGASLGANMNAMFQDNALIMKAQFGLK